MPGQEWKASTVMEIHDYKLFYYVSVSVSTTKVCVRRLVWERERAGGRRSDGQTTHAISRSGGHPRTHARTHACTRHNPWLVAEEGEVWAEASASVLSRQVLQVSQRKPT